MILWINGSFGAGKTTVAHELQRRLPDAFVYDPENVGYFLRKNAPEVCRTEDFQDVPLWREFNYETLKWMEGTYPGVILAPMTINRQQYFDEIIGRLVKDGVPVRHVILWAERETILRRLQIRNLRPRMMWRSVMKKESFAVKAIPRSLAFFASRPGEEKIITDSLTVDQVVEAVAARCGLALKEDRRSGLKRRLDRVGTLLGHIRG